MHRTSSALSSTGSRPSSLAWMLSSVTGTRTSGCTKTDRISSRQDRFRSASSDRKKALVMSLPQSESIDAPWAAYGSVIICTFVNEPKAYSPHSTGVLPSMEPLTTSIRQSDITPTGGGEYVRPGQLEILKKPRDFSRSFRLQAPPLLLPQVWPGWADTRRTTPLSPRAGSPDYLTFTHLSRNDLTMQPHPRA